MNTDFNPVGMNFATTGAERATFIKKTYTHLAGALVAFVILEYFLISSEAVWNMWAGILSARFGWLGILGLVMVGSWIAQKLAFNYDRKVQYAGLGIYVVVQAMIFTPLLMMVLSQSNGGDVLIQAGGMTVALFTGLTATVIFTNKDFSFLSSVITIGGFIALGLIVMGILFGFDLGLWFSVLMVGLAGASILYETSKIFKTYPTDFYVGAALGLFASFMLLLWYIIRIFMNRD